jgi:circadian clock protein KaiC
VTKSANEKKGVPPQLRKSPTGIEGLDEVTGGGLPTGRPTIVCGGPGCGKTMLGIEFLVRGAIQFDEPGVFMAFEETPEDLAQNVASLGFDLQDLAARKKLFLDYVHVERSEIQETGEYDLEGLFVRLQHAIDSVGAKRVVLDTLEALFSGFSNQGILRAELRRLFRWLKERNMTTIITAERGDASLTRYGLEEYVSDCVIVLDHRVAGQLSTRRLRIVKYRGSVHGTNEYPFLIDEHGISVLPITSFGLNHRASTQRISSGIPDLDQLLEGRGYYRGSTVLISGTAGSGKTSIASHFAEAACRRQERCLFLSFEESIAQVTRNMRSVGIDLEPWGRKGLLQFHGIRPTEHVLETHLARLHKMVDQFTPRVVVIDPITNLISGDGDREIQSMLMRLIDFLKANQITAAFTSLTVSGKHAEQSEVGISSLIDTWIVLRELEENEERNRGLYVVKSRGMAHSNQIRQFLLTDHGVKLVSSSQSTGGRFTGSAAKKNRPEPAIEQKKRKQKRDSQQRSAVARIRKTAATDQGKPFLAKAAGENR